MKEAMAVTGYVADEVARTLQKAGSGAVDIHPERGVNEVVARVQRSDIAEVRLGASAKGATLVQVILKENAMVETIVRTEANAAGLKLFHDPTLNRLQQAATAKNILV